MQPPYAVSKGLPFNAPKRHGCRTPRSRPPRGPPDLLKSRVLAPGAVEKPDAVVREIPALCVKPLPPWLGCAGEAKRDEALRICGAGTPVLAATLEVLHN